MAYSNSGLDIKVTSCSKKCVDSYAKLKKLYDEQRELLGDASIEIQAYTQALKKVEAQLVNHRKNQLWYDEKIRFVKFDLDDKTDVHTYDKKLLAEAVKEKEELKTKHENFQSSSKGLSKLLNSQISKRDKSRLGYGDQVHDGVLSYENEVFQSVFDSRSSDVEDSHVHDRFANVEGMHVVPPPMTGNYMPSGPDREVDDSMFTYGPKQSKTIEPKVVSQPKVWSDAPIIKEYESDSDDEYVIQPSKEQERPSFAFVNTFVPTAVLTRTGRIPVNTTSHNFNSQAVSTSAARKVNVVRLTVNKNRPRNKFHKTHSPIRRPFNRTTAPRAKLSNQKVNTAEVKAVSVVGGKRETVVKPSAGCNWRPKRHYWNKFSKYNGGSNSRKYVNSEDPNADPSPKWLGTTTFNLFSVSQMCDKKNKVLFTDTECLVLSSDFKFPDENQPVRSENQANKTAGPKEANHSAGTQDANDAGNYEIEAESAKDYFVLQYGLLIHQQSRAQKQRMKEANDAAEALRKEFAQDTKDLLLQAGAARATSFVDPKFPKKVYKVCERFVNGLPSSQAWISYVAEILKKFDFASVKTASTPIETQKSLTKDEEAVDMDVHLYRSMIGSLMYLTASRPNIMFAVCACFRFQVTPKTSHLNAVKRIFRYQKGKPKLGLWYPRVSSFDLEAYSDSDYSGANLDRKSTTGVSAASLVNTARPTLSAARLVVTEASIRSSLLLNDVNGTACLTNEAIFQNLALMGYEGELNKLTFQKALFSPQWKYLIHTILHCLSSKSTSWNEFSTNITSAVICLATNQKFNFSKLIFDGMLRNLDTSKKKFLMYPRFIMVFLNNQIELGEPFNDVYVTPSHTQKLFSNMSRKGVKFLGKVTLLFDSMLVPLQAPEGEGDHTSEKHEGGLNLEELFVLCTNLSNRVLALETSKDAQAAEILKLKDQIKKLKRKWRKNAKPEPNLDVFDDLDAGGRDYMETEDVVKEGRQSNETEEFNKGSGEKGGSAEGPVSNAIPKIVSTARPDVDAARQEDSAVKPKTPPTTTSIFDDEDITMAQTLIKIKEEKAKEKGVERERQREEEASKAAIDETYDEVQAGIDADALAAQRFAEIRSRPPTKSKLRNLMTTYLKNMGSYKHSQLKAKTFAEIQGFYERQKKVINDFKPMDSDDAVKDFKEAAGVHKQKVLEEPNSTKVEVKQEGHEESIRKRPGRRLKMKATKKSKRQKTDADLEEEEQLKALMKIVPEEEGIIDYEVLEKRFPIINWKSKFYDFDRHGAECIYYRIFRSDRSSRWIKTFSEMVTRFARLDLVELYNLVMKRFKTTTPEGVDLVLWGDLRTMFDTNAEDKLWKYPITKETLERILSLRLVAETASEDAYTLLRFIQNKELASPNQMALALVIPEQMATDAEMVIKDWKLKNLKFTKYGYIKNHKKIVKNGQARTRERKSVQKPEAKP
ncbi:hypothetical protein Tco_0730862 [Tanacetum coccineum]